MRQKTDISVEIKTIVLDTYLKGEPVNFIKMDIEGNEPIALRGMTSVLKQKDLILVFEYTPELVVDREELFDGLRRNDFTTFIIPHAEGAPVPFIGIPSIPMGSNANILCIKDLERVKQAARTMDAAELTRHWAGGYQGVLLDKDAASAAHSFWEGLTFPCELRPFIPAAKRTGRSGRFQ